MHEASPPNPSDARPLRRAIPARRLVFVVITMLVMLGFVGGAAVADGTADTGDVATFISVIGFVGSMVALALGMIGESFRP